MSANRPVPAFDRPFKGTIRAFGAIPVWIPRAQAIPATDVPWPWPSVTSDGSPP